MRAIIIGINTVMKSLVSVVVGFALGAFAASAWFLPMRLPSLPGGESVPVETEDDFLSKPSAALSVFNQDAGMTAIIESVTVPPPGVWVTIHELRETELGNVLGAARVRMPSSAITVELLRGTESGKLYAAALYRDDGDDLFDRVADSVYVDFDTGERVIATFRTNP